MPISAPQPTLTFLFFLITGTVPRVAVQDVENAWQPCKCYEVVNGNVYAWTCLKTLHFPHLCDLFVVVKVFKHAYFIKALKKEVFIKVADTEKCTFDYSSHDITCKYLMIYWFKIVHWCCAF